VSLGPGWVELVAGPYDGVVFHLRTGLTMTVAHGWMKPDREMMRNLPERFEELEPGVIMLEGVPGDAMYVQISENKWEYEPPGSFGDV
jgi:hypothetical protein